MVIQRMPTQATKEVLYIGSAVPLETSEGLEAIQYPLRQRYPANKEDIQGIMCTLSIIPDGIQLRYKHDTSHVVLFPFTTLTICAAVRAVQNMGPTSSESNIRFVSLSSAEAKQEINAGNPAIFTAITRRTKGRQVLECHGFITNSDQDAFDLVALTSEGDMKIKQWNPNRTQTLNRQANSTYQEISRDMHLESASLQDYPVQIVPGEQIVNKPQPGFFEEPPKTGYFYSTKDTQVKKYHLQKFAGGAGSAVGGDNVSVVPPESTLERRPGYAASAYSVPVGFAPNRRPVMYHQMRTLRPAPPVMRPVMMAPQPRPQAMPMFVPYPRPRFFSPPPMVARPRPLPVLVGGPPPPPPGVMYSQRRNSHGSSSSESSSSSDTVRMNGQTAPKVANGARRDNSSDSSRPVTPPTDYEAGPSSRMSRKDDFMRQNHLKERNGPRMMRGPPGFYLVPPYGGYYPPPPPPGAFMRARSVPPYGEFKSKKKEKKSKKKSGKKNKTSQDPSDFSAESTGYASEALAGSENRQPGDFRRSQNRYMTEIAFSKRLKEETRQSSQDPDSFNAYTLNQPQNGEFPMY